MKDKQKSQERQKKKVEKGTTHTSFSQNNVGTLGHVSYQRETDEVKGSFKKVTELVEKGRGPNVQGIGENEEDHSTKI